MSSAGAHVVAAGLLLWTSGPRVDATVEEPPTRTRLVFVVDPGRGSSGGGGTPSRPRPETRKSPEPPPEPPKTVPPPPLEATSFAAPVLSSMPATPSRVSTEEALDRTKRDPAVADGAGPGTTGGVGNTPRSGIGEGSGPGEGGAGYGNGRGVSPPRLLHEVKAVYTEDARRLGLTGEVVLSIVVEADGHVGNVRLVRGLGAGLDERAIAAVREWQFAPAKRLGTPVAVTVEAVVSFNLR
jgi:protein TonB